MNKILIIGDTHFREKLTYSEYIRDGREAERKAILDKIVDSASDCEAVVLLGDCFNGKNPPAGVIKDFVTFIESFGDKEIFIISGNHSKRGDGTTALDFLKEITNKPNWHVFTSPAEIKLDGKKLFFLPYMFRSELGVGTDEEAAKKIMGAIPKCDVIFLHHAISDTVNNDGTVNGSTNIFQEAILPKKELEKKATLVVGGHVHHPRAYGKTLVAGSVFSSHAGETEKFVYKLHDFESIEGIRLPGRHIYKLENPAPEDLANYPKNSIMKVILTDKSIPVEKTKDAMKRFDAHVLMEQYPAERKKMDMSGALDFNIENLLKVYAEAKGVDLTLLMDGFELIKK